MAHVSKGWGSGTLGMLGASIEWSIKINVWLIPWKAKVAGSQDDMSRWMLPEKIMWWFVNPRPPQEINAEV